MATFSTHGDVRDVSSFTAHLSGWIRRLQHRDHSAAPVPSMPRVVLSSYDSDTPGSEDPRGTASGRHDGSTGTYVAEGPHLYHRGHGNAWDAVGSENVAWRVEAMAAGRRSEDGAGEGDVGDASDGSKGWESREGMGTHLRSESSMLLQRGEGRRRGREGRGYDSAWKVS